MTQYGHGKVSFSVFGSTSGAQLAVDSDLTGQRWVHLGRGQSSLSSLFIVTGW